VNTKPSPRSLSPARGAAFDILLRVERDSSYASELLHSRNYSAMAPLDHSLTTELVMGVMRWRSLLDAKISQSSSHLLSKLDQEVLIALRLAVYQLLFLSRVPARAAIHESVELVKRARKRSAAPFVNAVLRKITQDFSANSGIPQLESAQTSAEALADASAHPPWLVDRWLRAYGFEAARSICRHNQSVPVSAVRLRSADAEASLRSEGIELAPGALLASARRVQSGDVTRTLAFKRGLCVIQDEASQLVAAMVGTGQRILDCCAAPGGKTLAVADRNPSQEILAAELHPHRARLVRSLLPGLDPASINSRGRIAVIAADARRLPFVVQFDRILADVPCSGTGTISRHPEIKWRLTEEDILDLQKRQLEILRSAMAQAAPGGRVIYSTCSLEREENEEVVEQTLADHKSFRLVDCGLELEKLQKDQDLTYPDRTSLTRGRFLRTLPGVQACDGFFAAILERSKEAKTAAKPP
jgi:16S rRNA (cytosine967-C5)-methyltransferase